MDEIIRNRTIRPSSRLETSKSYKINTKDVSGRDILIVNIDHESKSFRRTYKFNGADLANKASISFKVKEDGASIEIKWSGAKPIGGLQVSSKEKIPKLVQVKAVKYSVPSGSPHRKKSFDPISDENTSILILGTMPGDKSLELNEYYGHSRNRFWKIIATITKNNLPVNYEEKKELLLRTKIGVWDVAHQATRKGSLDSAIEEETPNDLEAFISEYPKLKVIGFNGAKAATLFDKYFTRNKNIKYVALPSTSPANARINFEDICEAWAQILK